jgi:hypothetical protein
VGSAVDLFAPAPDFRYVWLEPVRAKQFGVAATAFGLGAGVTLAMHGAGAREALLAGAAASIMSAFTLRGAAAKPPPAAGSARMAIVPWGVLVETDETPRILRWAAVRHVEVVTSRATAWDGLIGGTVLSSRVSVETDRDRFVGESIGAVRLERLVEHLDAYATEQATPLALDLDGQRAAEPLEPECEALLAAAETWLASAPAVTRLALPSAGYRHACMHAATPRSIDVLRRILRDRRPKPADPRAFAAVVAAELRATELVPELVSLTQCPHPLVAAFAKQAARKLGAPSAKTGTLDEIAPFFTWGSDRVRLERW